MRQLIGARKGRASGYLAVPLSPYVGTASVRIPRAINKSRATHTRKEIPG